MAKPPRIITRNACPLCGSGDVREIYRRQVGEWPISEYLDWRLPKYLGNSNSVKFDFVLMKCADCEGIYLKDVLSYFDDLHGAWRDSPEALWKKQVKNLSGGIALLYTQEVNLVKYMLGNRPTEQNVFDFGSGWGYWCQTAKAFGFEAYGTEVHAQKVENHKRLNVNLFDLENGSDMQFDFINSEQVFEHLMEPQSVLEILTSRLKPGGIIRISVPNGRFIEKVLKDDRNWLPQNGLRRNRKSIAPVAPFGHINVFTHDSLYKMARTAGLSGCRLPIMEYLRAQRRCIPPPGLFLEAYRHSLSGKTTILFFRKPKSK